MGGMNWLDNHDSTFTSDPTYFRSWTYSSLDLYLMGLTPASFVSPSFLIREPQPDYGQWGPLPATENPVTLRKKDPDHSACQVAGPADRSVGGGFSFAALAAAAALLVQRRR